MSITEDLRNVSEAALGKLAAQFGDLPRPLLAAIGAGDAAVERLVRLRDQLGERWNEERDSAAAGAEEAGAEDRGGDIDRDDVDANEDRDASSRLADATRRAQHIAEDVARRLGDAMGEMPDMAQRMIADLPAKAQEVANSLSRENLKDTVESYTRRVAEVYRELADRGGERMHEAADKNKADDAAAKERAQETAAPAKAAARTAPAGPSEPVTSEPAERKPATTKPGISKPTAHRSGTARPAAPRPVRRKPTDGDAAD